MTLNKLPPLPEPSIRFGAQSGLSGLECYSADQMHAYAAEALRQSQSLPAGAVAWCATSETGEVEALGMNQSRRFDTPLYLHPTLQADAREKGEAVAWVSEVEYRWMTSRPAPLSHVGVKVPLASKRSELYSIPLYATQPAQASEKE